jgi:insulysin
MQDILGLLFEYIKVLQQSGVSQWIFDEVLVLLSSTLRCCLLLIYLVFLIIHLLLLLKLSAICEAEFHYQAKIDPISYAVDISSNMKVIVFFGLSYFSYRVSFCLIYMWPLR